MSILGTENGRMLVFPPFHEFGDEADGLLVRHILAPVIDDGPL